MSDYPKLKDCLHCGGQARYQESIDRSLSWVKCWRCGLETPACHTTPLASSRRRAGEFWNQTSPSYRIMQEKAAAYDKIVNDIREGMCLKQLCSCDACNRSGK